MQAAFYKCSQSVWTMQQVQAITHKNVREVVQVKIKNFIYINGKPVEISTLTEDEKKEISNQLNEKAAEAIGYERTA